MGITFFFLCSRLFFFLYLEHSLSRTKFLVPWEFEIERFHCINIEVFCLDSTTVLIAKEEEFWSRNRKRKQPVRFRIICKKKHLRACKLIISIYIGWSRKLKQRFSTEINVEYNYLCRIHIYVIT